VSLKVSIITTCFNRERFINDAIESVLEQDYPDIEYIIVDGASTDNSLSIINRYSDKISKIVSERDNGMYEAINKGIKMATGDIIGLVHSDDMLYDKHVISDIVDNFIKTGADFIYGDGEFVKSEDPNIIVRNWIGGKYYKWKVVCGWLPLHPTCYICKDVMLKEGLYNENFKIAADSDLLVRYLYKANLKVSYIKRKIIRMRMGGLSTSKERRKQMWEEDIRLYKNHGFYAMPTKIMKMMWKIPQFIR
jgi:glycosyltransferase